MFLRKRAKNETPNGDEIIFMAAPDRIGYDATGRKVNNDFPKIVKHYRDFELNSDSYLSDTSPLHNEPVLVFAVKRSQINGRIDVAYSSPDFRVLRERIKGGRFPIAHLGEICESMESGFAAGGDNQAFDDIVGIPHIRPLNITSKGDMILEGTKYVPRANLPQRQLLTAGEVLFNNTNSAIWVGKTCVFPGGYEAACSNHITRIKVQSEKVLPEYLAGFLNLLRNLGFFQVLSTKFNNQAGVNIETLSMVLLPLPPISAQQEMITKMEKSRSEARQLYAQADELVNQAKARFEAALLGA